MVRGSLLFSLALVLELGAAFQAVSVAQTPVWVRSVPPSPPVGRVGSAIAYNSTSLILSGGRSGDTLASVPGDLTVSAATQLPTQQPASAAVFTRTQAASCAVPEDFVTRMKDTTAVALVGVDPATGLETDGTFAWHFKRTTNSWVQVQVPTPVPTARRGATVSFLKDCRAGRACFIVIGGTGPLTLNTQTDNCWIYWASGWDVAGTAAAKWQVCTQSGSYQPLNLVGHSTAVSPDGTSIFVFGGYSALSGVVNADIFQFKATGFIDDNTVQAEMVSMATGNNQPTFATSSRYELNQTGASSATSKLVTDGSTTQTYVPAAATAATAGCYVSYFDPVTLAGTTNPYWRVDIGYPPLNTNLVDNFIWQLRVFVRTDTTAPTFPTQGISFWVSNVTSPLPWESGSNGVQFPSA